MPTGPECCGAESSQRQELKASGCNRLDSTEITMKNFGKNVKRTSTSKELVFAFHWTQVIFDE